MIIKKESLYLVCIYLVAHLLSHNGCSAEIGYISNTGWMNDPNGLVYVDKVYHLFYQYNPNGNVWGNISWGHAVSNDLVSWQDEGVGLPYNPKTGEMIFSGSAVYDEKNTSNLGSAKNPPLVAMFTSFFSKEVETASGDIIENNTQSQSLAYSTDQGKTWKYYENNPVIKNPPRQYISEFKDFRDPKVFWYEPHKKWIVVTVLSKLKKALFFTSTNLKDWTLMSEFSSKKSPDAIWECPDIFELPVAGETKTKWVLLISTNPGGLFGGSGMHYHIGEFDGYTFKEDESPSNDIKWLDYGSDFYAGVTWNNVAPRRLLIGWVNNWDYALKITEKWRGAMSLVRELSLAKNKNDYALVQTPIPAIESYRRDHSQYKHNDFVKGIEIKTNESYEIHIDVLEADKKGLSIVLDDGKEDIYAKIEYDEKTKEISITKKNVLPTGESDKYVKHFTKYDTKVKSKITIFLDNDTLTLFVDKGDIVFTELLLSSVDRRLKNNNASADNLEVSMWRLSL